MRTRSGALRKIGWNMASMTRLELGAGQALESSSLLLGERLVDGVLALLGRRERGACGGAGCGGARAPPLEVFIGDLGTLMETGRGRSARCAH